MDMYIVSHLTWSYVHNNHQEQLIGDSRWHTVKKD